MYPSLFLLLNPVALRTVKTLWTVLSAIGLAYIIQLSNRMSFIALRTNAVLFVMSLGRALGVIV